MEGRREVKGLGSFISSILRSTETMEVGREVENVSQKASSVVEASITILKE